MYWELFCLTFVALSSVPECPAASVAKGIHTFCTTNPAVIDQFLVVDRPRAPCIK